MGFFKVNNSRLDTTAEKKNKIIFCIYHHISNRKKHTVLEGKFDKKDFAALQDMMGVGGFYIIKNDKAQKHGLKFRHKNTHLIVLRGFHWINSNNYTKLKKILTRLNMETQLQS